MNNTTPQTFDIAIIGGGFSGVITLANCLRYAQKPLRIALFSRSNVGRGAAYSTEDIHHLLNVPAHNMSAFPDAPTHFVDWLATQPDTKHYTKSDFVPRLFYGDYIDLILDAALNNEDHDIELIEEEVTAISKDRMITTATQTISAHKVVLATGNEAAQQKSMSSTISPWELLEHPLPTNDEQVLILGAGLTGVDAFLTLRARGFKGKIYLASRSGRIPQPHLKDPLKYGWEDPLPTTLINAFQTLKQRAATHRRWQEVVDSLRPHLQTIWKSQTIAARRRFLNKYFGLWNIHRHRMAPQIWAQLQADTQLEIIATRKTAVPKVALTIHCIGQEYRTTTLRNPLLQQLLRDQLLTAHETGFGVKTDGFKVGKHLYAIGPLLIGELLETTAVPELRVQADQLAKQLVALA
ncbi:MAG: FAD/NAD(P)-binding protein [Alphaproteobacteria bacterium]|nr:FAD/NAD(P)-binding protein [Alphaproteobacteria bacterium]